MKKIAIITGVFAAALMISSCRMGKKDPGRVYMPDMTYSRAYETYAALDSSKFTSNVTEVGGKIFYNSAPVEGTVARGEVGAFPIAIDKPGDSTNYVASKQVVNPLPPLTAIEYLEAARLYLINCGICHGEKLDGMGPLFDNGNGPYGAAPKNLIGDPLVSKMPPGQLFYSITYGKNAMGSYASQLSTKQRWMIVHYIIEKRGVTEKKPAVDTTTAATASK